MKRFKERCLGFAHAEYGFYTVESAMVFPLLLLSTAAVILFSLLVFRSAQLSYFAATTAERLADNWTNSHKDFESGAFMPGDSDGLYWRLLHDDWSELFSAASSQASVDVPIRTQGSQSLTERKLSRSEGFLPAGISGVLSYSNRILLRSVKADLTEKSPKVPLLMPWMIQQDVRASSVSHITEPIELIRTVDLLRTYGARLKQLREDPATREVLAGFGKPAPKTVIHSELEAKAYVRLLVNGRGMIFDTEQTGMSREVDALDGDGIAHEAKYTVNKKEASAQIQKDVELMKSGKIKGAVWHFFPLAKTGSVDLTESLRRDLENNGIVIVIHN